jgi:hypothetical protein
MFNDETGFNLHTQWNNGRSRKDTPAKGTVPTAKGITRSSRFCRHLPQTRRRAINRSSYRY